MVFGKKLYLINFDPYAFIAYIVFTSRTLTEECV